MHILIAGASGFIGSHLAAHLHSQDHSITAAGRGIDQARRLAPDINWIACDFRHDSAADWLPRLTGIDAVINCVGVLQDGLGDNSRAAHVDGAAALFAACEQAGVRRVIHISAVGADKASGSAYARDKQDGEAALKALDLDWVILRPSLVVARNVYGGTALVRALCGIPFVTPLVGGSQIFRPIGVEDLSAAVSDLLQTDAPSQVSWDVGGPQRVSMDELVRSYRRWLGFGDTRIWHLPRWLAALAFGFGDALGWIGVRTSMRTTALKQLDFDVEGDPSAWLAATGATPRGFDDYLASAPAGLQDRWHARLGFARPVARWVLGLYWLATGILSLTIARGDAYSVLQAAGYEPAMQTFLLWFGSAFDLALGLAMLAKWRVRWVAAIMIAGTFAYIATLSMTLPGLWADALGPILKVFPMMALALMIAATEDER
ncbi:NAD(P)H-binding protein [uncultured Maricaulis sp.]|uniref:NAD(P)H-binding protein n=1 Tax=uncultured Maricaulis sp. TaxID=174710 RepID=UPI0030D8616D|tara:strand:- start:70828 stop:72123 length:1296 start_codon:yes stop_codon:yes gene_type:complete